jgi:hypothetical protein
MVVAVLVVCATPNHHIYTRTKSATARTNSSEQRHGEAHTGHHIFFILAVVIIIKVVGIDKMKISSTLFFKNRSLFLPAISIFACYFI